MERAYKYKESLSSKKRQQTDLKRKFSVGLNVYNMENQLHQDLFDHQMHTVEKKVRCSMLSGNDRGIPESKGAIRSGTFSRNQIVTDKDWSNCQTASSSPVQFEERICSLGWDKKMKRKRSVGPASKRALDSDFNQNLHLRSSASSKLTFHACGSRADAGHDDSLLNPGTRIKIRNTKASRTSSTLVLSPDIQASDEASDGREQNVSVSTSMPLDMMHGQSCASRSAHAKSPLVGQRSHKILSGRRVNTVFSAAIVFDESRNPFPDLTNSAFTARDSSRGNNKCMFNGAAVNVIHESGVGLDKGLGPVPLSEDKEMILSENHTKEVQGCDDVTLDKTPKAHSFGFPPKRSKIFASVDGVKKHGKIETIWHEPGARIQDQAGILEIVPKTMSLETIVPGFKKTRSISARPPSGKRSLRGHRAGKKLQFQDPAEADDDHQEKLAAAASALKASYRACSSRFWRKVDPIFGPLSTEDRGFMKQQLDSGEKFEDSFNHIAMAAADFSAAGVSICEKSAQGEKLRESSSSELINSDKLSKQMGAGRLVKVSSLYGRVLSALIEEDESFEIHNIVEGISSSIQCASDDSHCDSCNYADIEVKDRDRLDFEAESKFDVQMHKRSCGDGFSCNKSVTSNGTRNSCVSDSLYSSGRWQGDDGWSHSDEFVSGMCQTDHSGSVVEDVNTCRTPISNCEYQLMGAHERLVLELESIGLYSLPGLVEEEVIDQDIMKHLAVLHQQTVKKKMNLMKVDNTIQVSQKKDEQDLEQVALDKLVEMAYKGRMVCRTDQDSKRVIRRVSKQAALGFMKRTVARCQTFEFTGQSCFQRPSLHKAIFSAIEREQADCVGVCTEESCLKALKHEDCSGGSGFHSAIVSHDSSHHDSGTKSLGSVRAARSFPVYGQSKQGQALQKGKKKDPMFNYVDCHPSSQGTASNVRPPLQANGKRSDRDTLHKQGKMRSNTIFHSDQQVQEALQGGQKEQSKMKAKDISLPVNNLGSRSGDAVPCSQPSPSIQSKDIYIKDVGFGVELASPGIVSPPFLKEARKSHSVEIDPLEDQDDLISLFDGDILQDCDTIGLETPMDDISSLHIAW